MADNRNSAKIFFELKKQKYYEALHELDRGNAVDILMKDLKDYTSHDGGASFKDLTQLLALDNIRDHSQLANYKDATSARELMLAELKKLIKENPLLCDILKFPEIKEQRLRMLINQSFNRQHSLCQNPSRHPEMESLFVDHICRNASHPYALQPVNNPMMGTTLRSDGLIPMDANGASTSVQIPLSTWMMSHAFHQTVFTAPVGPGFMSNQAAVMQVPGGSNGLPRGRPIEFSQRLSIIDLVDELPRTVSRTLNQGSAPVSMDFHPIQQTFLLVGTDIGEISLWEVGSRGRFLSRKFSVQNFEACSILLKAALVQDPRVSVTRVLWSPDGSSFGVSFSKNLVQIFTYTGGNDVTLHLEIDAHIGAVNDLAFCSPAATLYIITCGDDKIVKIWDVATGVKLYTFEGHEAPVFSLCPHIKENIEFFFSTSVDGRIKAWLYDSMGCRVDYRAPGRAWSKLSYSADGNRLFSCGTNNTRDAHLVEWNENDGTVKRSYQGYTKSSSDRVQFDTMTNRFLAVGDDFAVKFWDMDHSYLLLRINAEGGLVKCPCIRFNKEGFLLAVSAKDYRIKILANLDGLRLMRTCENHILVNLRNASDTRPQRGERTPHMQAMQSSFSQDINPVMNWRHSEINEPTQLQFMILPIHSNVDKISRLCYSSSGTSILALATNGIHFLSKWSMTEFNRSGKATTKDRPYIYQPAPGILMRNDMADAKAGEGLPCLAISKNDSYAISSSGGKVYLYNLGTLKMMSACVVPLPAATCLAFYPEDNNLVAIGMDDFSISIYDNRVDEVKTKLQGHFKRITGLAFSTTLNILVSAGADDQIIRWNCERWEREKNVFLRIRPDRRPSSLSGTQVEFHRNGTHFLAVHATQLIICEVNELVCVEQWCASSPPISHATFSCMGQLIFASFFDGSIGIFIVETLALIRKINPTAYLFPSDISSRVFPLVLAASPLEPNQFAAGLSNGKVYLFEPLETEGRWR